MEHTVYLSLGSNVGNRLHFLRQAVESLQKTVLTESRCSMVLETKALLLPNSPSEWNCPYVNMIVCGRTNLEPEDLLSALQSIEKQCGREPQHARWSPRTMDIDILLYDEIQVKTECLTIPHKELKNRDFLLHLLASMEPNLKYPGMDQTMDILAREALQQTHAQWSRSYVLYPQCVGIVNVTPDSFSDGGCYEKPDAAVAHCQQLINDGASVLDIGAQSTRPNSLQEMTVEEEWLRLQPVLAKLDLNSIPVSIDTYHEETVKKLLPRYNIAWVNDVSGRLPEKALRWIADAGCTICSMHALSVPSKTDEYVTSLSLLSEWGKRQVEHLTRCGFPLERIILDPGIGFGKTLYQTGLLLKTLEEWKRFGCQVLVGHSRKSFCNAFCSYAPKERDVETVALSLCLKKKVDYLRVHNVGWHQRALVAQHWVENCGTYTVK